MFIKFPVASQASLGARKCIAQAGSDFVIRQNATPNAHVIDQARLAQQYHPKIVVPDHSPVGDASLIESERAFMADIVSRTQALKSEGKSVEDTKRILAAEITAKYQGWSGLGRLDDAVGKAYSGPP